MGLLTGYQDDADRLARQEKTLLRSYNHDVRGLKAEAAPDEKIVKDYNAQVEGFKNSAVHRADKPEEVWQIIGGWISGNGQYAMAPVKGESQGIPFYGTPGTPESTYYANAGTGLYAGQDAYVSGQTGGWNMWFRDQAGKTIRSAEDGSPVIGRTGLGPVNMYASWNDRPFVAPVTKNQIDTAKASDERLKDIGARSDAMRAETDVARGLLSRKADRLEGDINMNKGAIANETQPDIGGSVFDQTKVFQSITDWLKG